MQEWLLGVLEAVIQQHGIDHLHRCVIAMQVCKGPHVLSPHRSLSVQMHCKQIVCLL